MYLKYFFLFFFTTFLNITALNITEKSDSSKSNRKQKRIYTTSRIKSPTPAIDGKLNDQCWIKDGTWAGNFTQWIPNEGAKPSQPTELKVLYDDKNIYVAIRAYDSEPEKMNQKAGRRDEFSGDIVGITFDSYHDHRTGFEFDVTLAGQKIDLVLTNSGWDVNWNAVWYGKSAIEDSAWTAEFEIPLSQLRYSSDDEQIWGMHCWRWIDRFQEESDWEPQSSTGAGILYQFGELHGIKGLPQFRHIEIMPYTLGKVNTYKAEKNNPYKNTGNTWSGNLGLDAKIGISSNFTADISVNPDFGQVESDPSVMNLTAFETFYEEKRPFFLEGKNIFTFDIGNSSLFYTRRIGQAPSYQPDLRTNEYIDYPDNTTILSAIKLSGKTSNGLAVGILQSLTANEKASVNYLGKEKEITVEPLTNYLITRIQQDYNEGNTVLGGIFTSANRFIKNSNLNFMNKNAYSAGLDLLHHWNDKEFYVDAKLVGSYINGSTDAIGILQKSSARYYQRPDANHLDLDKNLTSLSGYGGRISVGKGSVGLWRYSATVNWRSPGLDFNDLGYMNTADIINENNDVSYFVNQPVSIFRTYTISLNQFNNWDFGRNHLSSGVELSLYFEFLNNWAVSNSFNFTSQALDTRILRGGNAMLVPPVWTDEIYFRTDPSKKFTFELNTNFSSAQNSRLKYFEVQPEISYIPISTLNLSMNIFYSSNTDNLQYITEKDVNNESRYVLGKIDQHTLSFTFRIDYNITPEFSIQYYGSPFASVGKYSEFKIVSNPKSDNYSERYKTISPFLTGNIYNISENSNSQIDYTFDNPDFNFFQFRSNLVLRWEYLPGSQIYLVWSQDRTNFLMPGQNSVSESLDKLRNVYPDNIFLVKLNYWFTI